MLNYKTLSLYLCLLLFAFLVLLPNTICAVETDILQSEGVIVHFEKPLRNTANRVIGIYPLVKVEIEKTLGWRVDFRPTVMIVKEGKTFQNLANSSLVVAIAIPQKNLIIIDSSRANTHPFSLKTTLKHELSHLVLHHYIAGENLPKWLNEGISQWVSGGIAEIIINEKKDFLKQATLSRRFISLRDLENEFPEDRKSLLLAYEESKSIVEYINKEFGTKGIHKILYYLENGDKIDIAIQKSLSISLLELEERWHEYLKKKFTWFTYLSHNIYTVLFFLSALILIYGFIRFLIKKWTYKDEEDVDIGD